MVYLLRPDQIEAFKQIFEGIDQDKSGMIEPRELVEAINKSDYDLSKEEISRIIKEMEFDDSHRIHYTDFIAASMRVQQFMND